MNSTYAHKFGGPLAAERQTPTLQQAVIKLSEAHSTDEAITSGRARSNVQHMSLQIQLLGTPKQVAGYPKNKLAGCPNKLCWVSKTKLPGVQNIFFRVSQLKSVGCPTVCQVSTLQAKALPPPSCTPAAFAVALLPPALSARALLPTKYSSYSSIERRSSLKKLSTCCERKTHTHGL